MKIQIYRELMVFKASMEAMMTIFEPTKSFPPEEKYSLTDQVRRSSRSVCTNIGEPWRRRRYKAAFISTLNDSETEATKTQIWLEIALLSGYINNEIYEKLSEEYEQIISQLVIMINQSEKRIIKSYSGS